MRHPALGTYAHPWDSAVPRELAQAAPSVPRTPRPERRAWARCQQEAAAPRGFRRRRSERRILDDREHGQPPWSTVRRPLRREAQSRHATVGTARGHGRWTAGPGTRQAVGPSRAVGSREAWLGAAWAGRRAPRWVHAAGRPAAHRAALPTCTCRTGRRPEVPGARGLTTSGQDTFFGDSENVPRWRAVVATQLCSSR